MSTGSTAGSQQWKYQADCLLCIFATTAVFFAVSLLSSPVPGANEPHYLCKARSFADPAWCDRDFFLSSANAHFCFFWLVGPLTQVISFEDTAFIGRFLSTLVLAVGWTVLAKTMGLNFVFAISSAALFAFLSQLGSFSGEWLLDGFESKVASWGCGLAAVGVWIRGAVNARPIGMMFSGILCGIGTMLHPVVGGWIAVCICMTWAFDWVLARRRTDDHGSWKPVVGIIAFAFATIVVALPGLLPAGRMLLDQSLSDKDRELASFIQVFWRLKHHLDPTELTFAQWIYAGQILIVSAVAFLLVQRQSETRTQRLLLLNFFLASLIIALGGVAIGWHVTEAQSMSGWQWRAALLKFYPFRTFDAMLPIVAGIFVALVLQQYTGHKPKSVAFVLSLLFGGLGIVTGALQRETVPSGYSSEQYDDWQAACLWIRRETPESSLFLTPRESFAFKWYAERAEYVCYKDCPQDAAGIIEWNKRLWWLHDWTLESSTDGIYDGSDLRKLRTRTGCDFIITRILGPFETAPHWKGKHWQIFKVPQLPEATGR